MKKFFQSVLKRGPILPLQISMVFSMLVAAIGSFLGFGTDAILSGLILTSAALIMIFTFWYKDDKK